MFLSNETEELTMKLNVDQMFCIRNVHCIEPRSKPGTRFVSKKYQMTSATDIWVFICQGDMIGVDIYFYNHVS